MGQIKNDVLTGLLARRPKDRTLLIPFLNGFDVTWGASHRSFGTDIAVYFLLPEAFISQTFGIDQEIALFITDFPSLEPRVLQAVDQTLRDTPAKGRVEQSLFFLCSPSDSGRQWMVDYTAANPDTRLSVVFNSNELTRTASDSWFVRNKIREQLFSRNLFDNQLPIDSDLFFFGRDQLVADYLDAVKRSQNRGLFGLRKTGKTSVLYKLQRIINRDNVGSVFYYDAKLPSIRMLSWNELLAKITRDIAAKNGIKVPDGVDDKKHVSDALMEVLKLTPENKFTVLIFDEIEFISPIAKDDIHWHKDFVPFWQTLWAVQSQIRRLSNIIVGVNPKVVEMDTVDEVQNPIFGIVQPKYLRGFELEELKGMLKFFGKRMGITFEPDAQTYLLQRYGGHPLLIRMACSEVHKSLERTNTDRPASITAADLSTTEGQRDEELLFYCRHVVGELQRFYADEYAMLEMLASGQIADVRELSEEPEYTRHLRDYGLLRFDTYKRPTFEIPVVGEYVGRELARREKRQLIRKLIPLEQRSSWVSNRSRTISRELRTLTKEIKKASLPSLFGFGDFPEAERFSNIQPATDNESFVVFINICNRCFVESVESFGKSQNDSNYFWKTIKTTYPDLWSALHRIKVYRNNDLHLVLNTQVETQLKNYLDLDLEGKSISQVREPWFALQQAVLDELMLSIQYELARHS
ncbi:MULTISPECIES: ATP-binding protein [unclassified Pseudomonas]|uniref:ATP-binding protein n=1 Tax=unclassified Pseudomonas TaxID=196821 RepID=UPI00111C0352|nr:MULTISPECIES: ATP-binding protein [unclassified Pseudomonas]